MIKVDVKEEDVKHILLGYDPDIKIIDIQDIYYPYVLRRYQLILTASVGRLSKLNRYMNCSIDMVYGRPALTQGAPCFERRYVPSDKVLVSNLSEKQLNQIGHDFVFTYYLNKSKILRVPKITTETQEEFYKKFYIVSCVDDEEKSYSILMDALDGNITLL